MMKRRGKARGPWNEGERERERRGNCSYAAGPFRPLSILVNRVGSVCKGTA
jgi:hypothetical protein